MDLLTLMFLQAALFFFQSRFVCLNQSFVAFYDKFYFNQNFGVNSFSLISQLFVELFTFTFSIFQWLRSLANNLLPPKYTLNYQVSTKDPFQGQVNLRIDLLALLKREQLLC